MSEPAEGLPDDARNLDETARFFGRSLPTVRGWLADPTFPVLRRGDNGVPYALSLRDVKAWIDGNAQAEREEQERKAASDQQLRLEFFGGASLAEEMSPALSGRAKAEAIAAELAAMKLARERGELVKADELAIALAELLGKVRDQVRSIPDELARHIGLNEGQLAPAIERVDAILSDLANGVATMGAAA